MPRIDIFCQNVLEDGHVCCGSQTPLGSLDYPLWWSQGQIDNARKGYLCEHCAQRDAELLAAAAAEGTPPTP